MTKRTPFYFDNCRICQLMKDSHEREKSLSSKQLEEAFAAQKEKNMKSQSLTHMLYWSGYERYGSNKYTNDQTSYTA